MTNNAKKWENDIYTFDVTETSREINPWLENYGMDRLTYTPEKSFTSAAYFKKREAPFVHGYPYTAWL